MANTGYKQATIAYKVSKPDGEPLDVDGNLTRLSGKRQAIALLTGHSNPDPSKYEVELYYDKGDTITGNPTITRDVTACPVGLFIRLSTNRIILGVPSKSDTFILESSNDWQLISGPNNYIDIDYKAGSAGIYTITATGVAIGDGYFTFQNLVSRQTVTIYIANIPGFRWILETGKWDNLGVWLPGEIWKME